MNSFRAMLFTRFVIGEETLSRTSAFCFSHWAIFSNAINSFFLGPVVGHYRQLPQTTLPRSAGHIKSATLAENLLSGNESRMFVPIHGARSSRSDQCVV